MTAIITPSIRACVLTAALLALAVLSITACFNAAPSECIEAAEAAGLPDEVIEQLRNPGDLNAVERAALNRALSQAGIDDVCEVSSDSASVHPGAGNDSKTPTPDRLNSSQRISEEPTIVEHASDTGESGQLIASYAECLDDVYLRAADDYDGEYWLPAAVWYCRELAPERKVAVSVPRCNLDQMAATNLRYPEWADALHFWHAIAVCNPLPAPDTTYIKNIPNIQPTVFSLCLDNAYLTNTELIGNREVVIGISTWLCQDYLPEPPPTHRPRCDLNHIAETSEIYPEWPEDLHNWHAIMQCLPEWSFNQVSGESVYATCLGDVYWQVADRYPDDHAIPAAVWWCRDHVPEAPAIYNPRCELNFLRRDEESQFQLPEELYTWNAIVQCYPKYKTQWQVGNH